MVGSGWKVVIINEADRMTPQAEVMWLDGLEKLPAKTVVVFTTNNPLLCTSSARLWPRHAGRHG
jgi:DNA polymerase III delta prime subunit